VTTHRDRHPESEIRPAGNGGDGDPRSPADGLEPRRPDGLEPRRPDGLEPRRPDGPDLQVNGEARRVPEGCTVAGLLDILEAEGMLAGEGRGTEPDRPGRRVAVAVNREVVPRSRFAEHALSAGDRVEILEAVGGG